MEPAFIYLYKATNENEIMRGSNNHVSVTVLHSYSLRTSVVTEKNGFSLVLHHMQPLRAVLSKGAVLSDHTGEAPTLTAPLNERAQMSTNYKMFTMILSYLQGVYLNCTNINLSLLF